MEENAGQVTSMLDAILKRLDEQMALSNKRYDEQIAFRVETTKGMQNFQKQLYLTQKEVDETLKATTTPPPLQKKSRRGRNRLSPRLVGGCRRLLFSTPPPITTPPSLGCPLARFSPTPRADPPAKKARGDPIEVVEEEEEARYPW